MKRLISLLAILSMAPYQFVFAHDSNKNYDDYESREQTKKEKRADESWDKFLKAVKKQDEKKSTDNQSGDDHSND